MNYAEIKRFDIANGVGTRTTLFVSGCRHHCPGCFNEVAWSFSAGRPFTDEVADELIESLEPRYVAGLSVLGGEPLEPENQEALLPFLRRVRERWPLGTKSVWMYTGFTWEQLLHPELGSRAATPLARPILGTLDVLVDGPFVLAEKDISLRFRGSANQRIIDVPASLAAPGDGPVPWEDDPVFATHAM